MLVELIDIYGAPWWVNPDHVVSVVVAHGHPTVAASVEVVTGRDNRGSLGNTVVRGKVGDIAAKLNAEVAAKLNAARDR
jgi:hypothetical protein